MTHPHRIHEVYKKHYAPNNNKKVDRVNLALKKTAEFIKLDLRGDPSQQAQELVVDFLGAEENENSTENHWRLAFDTNLVAHALKAYNYDIIRYVEFHFDDGTQKEDDLHSKKRIDGYKQAAYMTKWLTEFKPLSLIPPCNDELSQELKDLYININSIFIFFYVCSLLKIKAFTEEKTEQEKDGRGSFADVLTRFKYQLRYRPYNEGAFTMMFDFMQKAYAPEAWKKEKRHAEITPPSQE